MADFTTYEGVIAFAKQILISFAQNSKVAIFNDPNNQILTIKGKETAIREVETAGAGDYTGAWGDGVGNAEIDYKNYYAPYDRAYSASIDSLKEAQSFVEGAKPSINGVATEYIKKHLVPEIDSVVLARYASQVAADNVHANSESGYGVTAATIIETLTNIAKDVSNAGYDGDIVVFISATVNAVFQQALLNKNILLNEETIKRAMTRDEVAEGFGPLEVEFRVRKFNNMIIVPVPDDRMAGKYLMLNGIDAGQENGGVLPQKNSSAYFDSNIIAIPFDAAYANIRHFVTNLFVPKGTDEADYSENIALANEKLFGVVTLEDCGISQKGDGYSFNNRCVYGGDIFEKYRGACVLVKGATGAQTVAPTKATVVSPASALSGAKTTTSDVKIAFEALNASGTVYFVSATTGSATVDASETLTVPTSGDDLRPYCSPTVTFGNTAGTSVISVYSDSGKTIKIGEFTVTSEG